MSESHDELDYAGGGLPQETNWWGAFVIGLAGTILVTGIAPVMVTYVGAASIPAIIVVILYGERGTGPLLILSQVILSLQLSFAVFPLVMFTGDRAKMGPFVSPRWMQVLAWVVAVAIALLNVYLLYKTFAG